MIIGFDYSQAGSGKAGCGYFAYSLAHALAEVDKENTYYLYPTFGDFYWDEQWKSSIKPIVQPNFHLRPGHQNFIEAQTFWRNIPNTLEEFLGFPTILHANNFYSPLELPNTRLIYTLHDLAFMVHPEWTTEKNRTGCLEGVFRASVFADWIIAVSEATRNDFLAFFPHYPENRITVVNEASRFDFQENLPRPKKFEHLVPGQFWLNVSTIEPRKNQIRLLEAYALHRLEYSSYPLVIAGGKGWLLDNLETYISRYQLEDSVFLTGYVLEEELQWLYQNCFGFIFPSLYEGFGLPVLEAMSCGAPVLTSNVSSMPEVAGKAALFFDPLNVEEIRASMNRLMEEPNLREELKEMGLQRARQFSWRKTALEILEIYKKTVSESRLRDLIKAR